MVRVLMKYDHIDESQQPLVWAFNPAQAAPPLKAHKWQAADRECCSLTHIESDWTSSASMQEKRECAWT